MQKVTVNGRELEYGEMIEIQTRENKKWPNFLKSVPKERWPKCHVMLKPLEIWRSREFLVQIFKPINGGERMSVNRTEIDEAGGWRQGISWDELMKIKHQVGRGESWAVEIYPPESRVVNVANMRHVWLVEEPPAFAWKREA
jgi:hypothetical protein